MADQDKIVVPDRLRVPPNPSPKEVVEAVNGALREISAAIRKLEAIARELQRNSTSTQ